MVCGRFLYFGEVEIFFAFPDALSNIAKGEVIYMVMTWELFFPVLHASDSCDPSDNGYLQ